MDPAAARFRSQRPKALPLPFHQLSSSVSWCHRKITATRTKTPAPTFCQEPEAASTSTLNAMARMAGRASVRNTVLATYRRWDRGRDTARTKSKHMHTTTRACPRDIRTCPGSEPANRTAAWSPGLMACPSGSQAKAGPNPAAAVQTAMVLQWTDQAGLNHACDAPRRLRCSCAGSAPGPPAGAVSVSCQPFLTLQFNARHGPEVTQIRYPTIGWPDTCLSSGVLSSHLRLLAPGGSGGQPGFGRLQQKSRLLAPNLLGGPPAPAPATGRCFRIIKCHLVPPGACFPAQSQKLSTPEHEYFARRQVEPGGKVEYSYALSRQQFAATIGPSIQRGNRRIGGHAAHA